MAAGFVRNGDQDLGHAASCIAPHRHETGGSGGVLMNM
jgi:hypothetical protein